MRCPSASTTSVTERGDMRLPSALLHQPARFQPDWRRLVVRQVLELLAELVDRQTGRRGQPCAYVGALEIVASQPDHVAPGDRVSRGVHVYTPYARTARAWI